MCLRKCETGTGRKRELQRDASPAETSEVNLPSSSGSWIFELSHSYLFLIIIIMFGFVGFEP